MVDAQDRAPTEDDFGAGFRRLRLGLRMSLGEMAQMTGIHLTELSRIENNRGRAAPTRKLQELVCELAKEMANQ
jgi:transcriptional regulator with XRE-family HTH domain